MIRSKEEMLASQRIQGAREALGLSVERVAAELSLGLPWYRDLEANSEEVFSNISLAHLQLLAYVLQVEPACILLGAAATAPIRRSQFSDVKAALHDKMEALAIDPGDNLDKERPADHGERGVISIHEADCVRLDHAARSRPARSKRRANARSSPTPPAPTCKAGAEGEAGSFLPLLGHDCLRMP